MKKALNWLCRIFIVVALVIVACMIFSRVMDIKIHELYERNPVGVNHISGVGQKDKGSILLNETLQDDQNILVMASSELGSPVPENIKKLFPNDQYDGDISCVGHGHVQNLVHAINLGSNYDIVRDNNIVVIEGLQWFMGEEQDIDGFFSNFSEKQFYDFLCNDNISRESKKYLCNRYIDLERDHLAYFLRTMDESGVAGSAFRYFKHIFPDDSI